MYVLGLDIGGTKCAAVTAEVSGDKIDMISKSVVKTDNSITADAMLDLLLAEADKILTKAPDSVGISCGGPLDSGTGVIIAPPNLPNFRNFPIVDIVSRRYNAPVKLQNDANACALAEWRFGAGRGTKNMVFLTFGTGLGAGLILDGRLYEGTNGNAGEVGHIRLSPSGPVGFGKAGSFEGFCSGGGIAQLGKMMTDEALENGVVPSYYREGMDKNEITAKLLGDHADAGDPTALAVYRKCGYYLGRGLSVIIDVLNPERIVIGSIFARSSNLLVSSMEKSLNEEALVVSRDCCKIVPAELGEKIGDVAAIAVGV